MNLNIKRAVEEIRLSDDADSPVFYLDMNDIEMARKYNEMQKKQRKFEVLQGKLAEANGEEDQLVPIAKECATLLKDIITVCLGADACKQIVNYIKGDRRIPDYKITTYLCAVVVALMNLIKENYVEPLADISERAYVDQDKQPTITVI